MAAQFTATSLPFRLLQRWMALATPSLPVPVSPSTTMGTFVNAAPCSGWSMGHRIRPAQYPGTTSWNASATSGAPASV